MAFRPDLSLGLQKCKIPDQLLNIERRASRLQLNLNSRSSLKLYYFDATKMQTYQ